MNRTLSERAFARVAGAGLIAGNTVRLLRDAGENYGAWFAAIAAAEHSIHIESYLIHGDAQGQRFADAVCAQARRGVRVRVLYDWLGAVKSTSRRYWRCLQDAGVEVRAFNPPDLGSPFGWLSRDHRKAIVVDGQVAFVSGLCVGDMWVGDPARGREPWRDTGVEIRGPAVAEVDRAFRDTWALAGPPVPDDVIVPAPIADGGVGIRVLASAPSVGNLYRLDKLVAALARERLWLTDAYFVGGTSYVQALVAAARDGVDVRLLVPGASDIPLVRALSRAGYRTLLEGGVRVFEWNGTMLHAKTAVADGYWGRVGSTNLNPMSWLGNWELDVAVEDEGFARYLEAMFEQDLGHATEIVLGRHRRVRTVRPVTPAPRRRHRRARMGRAVAGVVGVGHTVGAAITRRRTLGRDDVALVVAGACLLLGLTAMAVAFPRVVAVPVAFVGAWTALGLLARALRLWRTRADDARTGAGVVRGDETDG